MAYQNWQISGLAEENYDYSNGNDDSDDEEGSDEDDDGDDDEGSDDDDDG